MFANCKSRILKKIDQILIWSIMIIKGAAVDNYPKWPFDNQNTYING